MAAIETALIIRDCILAISSIPKYAARQEARIGYCIGLTYYIILMAALLVQRLYIIIS